MIKLAIVGSRTFTDEKLFNELMAHCDEKYIGGLLEVISGGAKGVDSLAVKWANEHNLPTKVFNAEWDNLEAVPCAVRTNKQGYKYNALAGHNRNAKIIQACNCILAIWDGESKGTLDSIKKAKELGKLGTVYNFKTGKEYELKDLEI